MLKHINMLTIALCSAILFAPESNAKAPKAPKEYGKVNKLIERSVPVRNYAEPKNIKFRKREEKQSERLTRRKFDDDYEDNYTSRKHKCTKKAPPPSKKKKYTKKKSSPLPPPDSGSGNGNGNGTPPPTNPTPPEESKPSPPEKKEKAPAPIDPCEEAEKSELDGYQAPPSSGRDSGGDRQSKSSAQGLF